MCACMELWSPTSVSATMGRPRLLALLVIHANEVIRTDRLVDELWGKDHPRRSGTKRGGAVSSPSPS